MGGVFPYLHLFKKQCLHLNIGMEFVFLFSYVRLQNTTKEAFVANGIQLALGHCQLFTHHHAVKNIEATTKYRTNMGIPSSSSSSEE
jgi:hypothetical protein